MGQSGIQLRVYGGTLTFKTSTGYNMTSIEFHNGRWNEGNNADSGSFSVADKLSTWTGSASELTVNIAGNSQLNKIVVHVDDVTAIEYIVGDTEGDGAIYTLSGQHVANPSRGIYIVNGKKVLVK